MHEFSMIENIFPVMEKVATENQLKSVHTVTLRLGKLQQYLPEFVEFAFQTIAKGTIADDARLILEETEGKDAILVSIEGEKN